MSIKFTKLSSILLITAISSLFTLNVRAEDHQKASVSLADSFNNAYFEHAGDSFEKSSLIGQLNTITGIQGFPDVQISNDAKSIDIVYQDAISQQSQVGAPIKTRDLDSPYGTSLLENPNYIGY